MKLPNDICAAIHSIVALRNSRHNAVGLPEAGSIIMATDYGAGFALQSVKAA
jgi:hypothetical protein